MSMIMQSLKAFQIMNILFILPLFRTSETITTYDIEDVVKTNILGTTKILKVTKKYNYKKVVVPTTPDLMVKPI